MPDVLGASAPVVRKALIADVPAIQALVNRFAGERKMLSRSLSEIYENVRDFFVVEDRGAVVGSAALHIFWGDLAEVRALAVAQDYQRHGFGRSLVAACRDEARRMGIKRVFALTFQAGFFRRIGFSDISKNDLPHKVWSDCIKCPMFPDCDETALILDLEPPAAATPAAAVGKARVKAESAGAADKRGRGAVPPRAARKVTAAATKPGAARVRAGRRK